MMGTKEVTEKAECRGCKRELNGTPYYMGGSAYHPVTGERCKVNFYGGYICSEHCDRESSQELEDSMPGHHSGGSLSCHAKNNLNDNWGGMMPEKKQPIEKEFQEKMRALGIMLNDVLNESGKKETGFCLLSFKFGEPTEYSRINYISNSNRKDMIKALEDFLERENGHKKQPANRRKKNNLFRLQGASERRKTDKLIH